MSKRTVLEIALIFLIVIVVGILYNESSPGRLQYIGEEKKVDYSKSDSMLIALKRQDSLQKAADSLLNNSLRRDDSLKAIDDKRIQDSIMNAMKQDSLKHKADSIKTVKQKLEDSIKNAQSQQNFIKPIDIKLDFAKALFDKNYQFIDARDVSDYQAGTIKGAINISYHHLDENQGKINSLKKDAVYVVFCSASCDVSIDLSYAMAKQGFTKLYIFHGGWDEWQKAGYPAN